LVAPSVLILTKPQDYGSVNLNKQKFVNAIRHYIMIFTKFQYVISASSSIIARGPFHLFGQPTTQIKGRPELDVRSGLPFAMNP
jgi:hypothetical protein